MLAASPGNQLMLPSDHVPVKVKLHGLRDAHSYPLVSRGKDEGNLYSFRVAPEKAWSYPSIELRSGNSWPSLILDLDDQAGLLELYRLIQCEGWPEFNWKVQRVVNGHSHVVWNLADPVHRGEGAREGPLRAFSRVAEYYASTLKADQGYTGVLTHNPMSKAHGPGFKTHWLRRDPYKLGELGSE